MPETAETPPPVDEVTPRVRAAHQVLGRALSGEVAMGDALDSATKLLDMASAWHDDPHPAA